MIRCYNSSNEGDKGNIHNFTIDTVDNWVLKNKGEKFNGFAIPFFLFLFYPLFYELFQMVQAGCKHYFLDPTNLNNILFNFICILNCYMHITHAPYYKYCKLSLVFVMLFSLIRILEMIRIYKSFSPIYTMMTNVLWDFKEFALFFVILLFFLSVGISIL